MGGREKQYVVGSNRRHALLCSSVGPRCLCHPTASNPTFSFYPALAQVALPQPPTEEQPASIETKSCAPHSLLTWPCSALCTRPVPPAAGCEQAGRRRRWRGA